MAEEIVYGRHSRGASGGADCRKVRVRPAGGPAGVREVEGRARTSRQAQRAQSPEETRVSGYPQVSHRRAEFWRTVRTALAVALLVALAVGQAWQLGYTQGTAAGYGEGRADGTDRAYERGYSAAVSDYQGGVAEWARE